ncbi:hypothetical protein D9M73_162640 [compost metagenome]
MRRALPGIEVAKMQIARASKSMAIGKGEQPATQCILGSALRQITDQRRPRYSLAQPSPFGRRERIENDTTVVVHECTAREHLTLPPVGTCSSVSGHGKPDILAKVFCYKIVTDS